MSGKQSSLNPTRAKRFYTLRSSFYTPKALPEPQALLNHLNPYRFVAGEGGRDFIDNQHQRSARADQHAGLLIPSHQYAALCVAGVIAGMDADAFKAGNLPQQW